MLILFSKTSECSKQNVSQILLEFRPSGCGLSTTELNKTPSKKQML